MRLHIRTARPDDAGSIVGILNPIIEAGVYTAFDAKLTVQQERSYIDRFPPRCAIPGGRSHCTTPPSAILTCHDPSS